MGADPGGDRGGAGSPTVRTRRAESSRARVGRGALLLVLAATAWACTEDALTGPGPEEGEQEAARTTEVTVAPGQMASWRDTTYTGFALPSDAGFLVLVDQDDFRSRALLRYGGVPDSVTIDDETVDVEAFRNGRIRLVVDTSRVVLPSGDLTVRVLTLDRRFRAPEATWTVAREGVPWDSAGGDFDREVGRVELSGVDAAALADTVDVPLGATTDSLLSAWVASGGQPGVAVVLGTQGARIRATAAFLAADIDPAGRDTTLLFRNGAVGASLPSTFIFDPPVPAPGRRLRVGGLPASRFYLSFRPPVEVDGARLPGSTINRAELVFRPAPPPPSPFALTEDAVASGIRLPADPFALGARTPIGDTLQTGTRILDPDSLAAGGALRFEVTGLLRRWASNPDSAGELGIGVRLRPDAQTVRFWEFGSEASSPALRPFLRLIVTPPSDFDVP